MDVYIFFHFRGTFTLILQVLTKKKGKSSSNVYLNGLHLLWF